MFKLAALGALGYAGYKYFQKNGNPFRSTDGGDRRRIAVAGGPISERATVQHTPPA